MVYVVCETDYDDTFIFGVYSDLERARRRKEAIRSGAKHSYSIGAATRIVALPNDKDYDDRTFSSLDEVE